MQTETEKIPTTEENLTSLVRKYGDLNSDALLDKNCLTFQSDEIEGFVGYKKSSGFAVVFGEPVTSEENKFKLALKFHEYCQKERLKIIYIMVSEHFVNWALTSGYSVAFQFGTKLLLNPKKNPTKNTGSKAVLLRKKVKHASQDGVSVKEYQGEPSIKEAITAIGEKWLKGRKGAQIHIASISLFESPQGKRWFYAEKNGEVVGILLLNKIHDSDKNLPGWLMNNIMLSVNAPNGTSELLAISALQVIENEGCELVIAGPIPAKEITKIVGFSPFMKWITLLLYNFAQKTFRLNGHGVFWEKFNAEEIPSFLLFEEKKLSFRAIKAIMHALNVSIS